ncbi:MAG: protein-glutamate methylesterase/protein-glutamine glutaminase [Acidibrevibacterium sp.]|uniref:protein-glutamate methylesterase/protein-glutamine glutaminase n=1 Tax=Acidibrevibacterium sp. TaxID=2606776 RepID=UPI003D04D45F
MIAASTTAATPRPATNGGEAKIRVAICDDSLVIRGALARMLEAEPDFAVVARIGDGAQAVATIRRLATTTPVDVLILDIEMPVLDGMAALPQLLEADPGLRVIMASTLTTRGAEIALRALRLGAADYVPKPSSTMIADDSFRRELIAKIRGLVRLRRSRARPAPSASAPPVALRPGLARPPRLLAIGSSTGGPQALFTLIPALGKALSVPVVLTQHMPATFTPILAEHLGRLGGMPCAEARDGEALQPGHIYLAPGDHHLLIQRDGTTLRARLSTDPPVNFCRPAVDPMLQSAASACEGRVLVVMLTGMGHDGREGTSAVVAAGGAAIAQDEESSVVWGMPGAIAQAKLCHAVLPLTRIAPKVLEMIRR